MKRSDEVGASRTRTTKDLSAVAKKIITYEAIGTTWKVHHELRDSPGLVFVQDYLKDYDLTGLEYIEVKLGNWGYGENNTWTNTAAGHCSGPWITKNGKYQAVCKVNGRTTYPSDDWVTARTPKGKRKVPYTVYSQAESLVGIVAHEVCHYLAYTEQIPKHGKMHTYRRRSYNSTDEVETGEFEMGAIEAYRVANRDTPPPMEPVTDADTSDKHCLQCGMVLLGDRSKFCSDECRWTYHNRLRHDRGEPDRQKVCEVCGTEFTATRSDAKTCSPRCRQRLRRRIQRL
jgi:predicted nucleic acid-binding Zn ribbon protein